MLARLSSSDYPVLAGLQTRDDDDFTIAFLDASAIVLDILTFYQERLANESYLRTAGRLQSLIELSRLIGYRPSPGVSASAYVAFTLKAAPGQAPDPSAPAITIPKGTQLQSVPAQGQTAQTFETSTDISAKADWNALPLQTGQPWVPADDLALPGVANRGSNTNGIYLSGASTQLQPGDALLFLGAEREAWDPSQVGPPVPIFEERYPSPTQEKWAVVVLNQVRVDTVRQLTYVSWDSALTHASSLTQMPAFSRFIRRELFAPWTTVKVFAFRQKASLFGHNAPNPNLFVNLNASPLAPINPNLIDTTVTPWQWKNFAISSPTSTSPLVIDLDTSYPKIVAESWFALTGFQVSGEEVDRYAQLYKVENAHAVSISNFGLSGKVSELAPDYQDPYITTPLADTHGGFSLQGTEVWAQTDLLQVAEQPLNYPLYGSLLDLQDLRPDLANLQVVALFGKRQKISVAASVFNLVFLPDDGTNSTSLKPGDTLTLTGPPPLNSDGSFPDWSQSANQVSLSVEDANGRTGTVSAALNQFVLTPSGASDPNVSEYALVSQALGVLSPYPHTQIQLVSPLSNCYDRYATTVNANVALATNGSSVSEIMGNGSAATPNQSFTLRQSPLTYVSAPTPTGGQSTLQVQANGVTWSEVPSLYEQGPSQAVFATLNQPGGTTEVLFGDGVEGSTLPTGQNNIQANYRIGLGSAGNVAANSLTTLIDRPLGVSGVTNPEAATGGQDPQVIGDVRSNAPLTVLTLGRAVSLADYQNFAGNFAGIAKAYALWIASGPGRGVFLTVAGVNGTALPAGSPTLVNLVAALQNFGDALIPITAVSFVETLFGLSADLKYDPSHDADTVKAQVLQALYRSFGFAARSFGQGVSQDQVATVIQAVPGVVAVNVKGLLVGASSTGGDLGLAGALSAARLNDWRRGILAFWLRRPQPPASVAQIYPYVPMADPTKKPTPAEILVLNPDSSAVTLGVMS